MTHDFTGHDDERAPAESRNLETGEVVGEGQLLPRPHLLGGVLYESDRPVDVSENDAELVVGELLQMLPSRFQHGYERLPNLLGASGVEMDHNPAAIFYIALAADEVEPFQSIDEPCDRAC